MSYVNDHILKVLEKKEDQAVLKVLDALSKKYGRSRLEKMEVWMDNWFEIQGRRIRRRRRLFLCNEGDWSKEERVEGDRRGDDDDVDAQGG